LRDPYTGGHSRQVAEWVARALRELNVFGLEAELITFAARVHDIGKMSIPDGVLHKEGKLTTEEWDVMKSHSGTAQSCWRRYSDFERGAEFVRAHHERWDGKGYPRGLKGTDIPFGGTRDRGRRRVSRDDQRSTIPARHACGTRAVLILRAGRGTQWDPSIVDAFIRVLILNDQVSERMGQPLTTRRRSPSRLIPNRVVRKHTRIANRVHRGRD